MLWVAWGQCGVSYNFASKIVATLTFSDSSIKSSNIHFIMFIHFEIFLFLFLVNIESAMFTSTCQIIVFSL